MKISELIQQLQEIHTLCGDIDVASLTDGEKAVALNGSRVEVVEDTCCTVYGMADGVNIPYVFIS
ncbi:hypothetical protein SAMN03159335_06237 [Burkholderia cepacia]|uniref:hypothetical protein n=1 Tax=Burkholderia cepacia TaxID=292 RepID=UPI0008D0D954|nr:hypothetical protein [Burkholderia cepacia]SEU40219.1 hypothetical protein SAMN03159335_06237 [Burkholderia cepacia]